ncbi:hypothetical protein [Asaia prunellae]|uniref:hypothetical protein n=1 Tax=Asaia prunellae TaxID=610245 RepID=UPI000471B248|nr:hypothetical protein [Asaia prunellae]
MNYYQAYRLQNADPAMIRQGFSWRFLILGPVALLFPRCWISFALTASLNMLLLTCGGRGGTFLTLAVNLTLAFFSAELIGWEARLKGGVCQGVWLGRSEDDARLRLVDRMRISQ